MSQLLIRYTRSRCWMLRQWQWFRASQLFYLIKKKIYIETFMWRHHIQIFVSFGQLWQFNVQKDVSSWDKDVKNKVKKLFRLEISNQNLTQNNLCTHYVEQLANIHILIFSSIDEIKCFYLPFARHTNPITQNNNWNGNIIFLSQIIGTWKRQRKITSLPSTMMFTTFCDTNRWKHFFLSLNELQIWKFRK